MRSFVIGDIHGCLAELTFLINNLPLEQGDRIVFLGDYIDRGPDSKGVVSYLVDLKARAVYDLVFLKGNHEDMLMSYLGLGGQHGDVFWPTAANRPRDGLSAQSTANELCNASRRILDFIGILRFRTSCRLFFAFTPGFIRPSHSKNKAKLK
jgi:predicted MPP superfamily phosphohydrolase